MPFFPRFVKADFSLTFSSGYSGKYSKAIELLDTLSREDDTCVDVWHLGGVALRMDGQWRLAREQLETARKLLKKSPYEDETLMGQITQYLSEVDQHLQEHPEDYQEEEAVPDDGDDQYEDIDDDDMNDA